MEKYIEASQARISKEVRKLRTVQGSIHNKFRFHNLSSLPCVYLDYLAKNLPIKKKDYLAKKYMLSESKLGLITGHIKTYVIESRNFHAPKLPQDNFKTW